MSFTNLLMDEVPRRTGTAKFHTTPETIHTIESTVLTCNTNVSATLTFWFVAFFYAGRLFGCIALSNYASRKSSRIWYGPVPVLRAQ